MKYITHNNYDISLDCTSLQGRVEAPYSAICHLFGQPFDGDGHKVDAEWAVEFEDGTIASIYNWKNGKNYLGRDGYDTVKITNWNVGGHNDQAFKLIKFLVENHLQSERGPFYEGYESFCKEEVGHTWNRNN